METLQYAIVLKNTGNQRAAFTYRIWVSWHMLNWDVIFIFWLCIIYLELLLTINCLSSLTLCWSLWGRHQVQVKLYINETNFGKLRKTFKLLKCVP